MIKTKTSLYLLLILSTVTIVTSGCGKKEANAEKASETQVVAKVNGDEISIHQINFQLSRMGQLNEVQSKAAAKQVLASLIDQQILKQKAIADKLDRDPTVLQALETSKSQILAQAYLEQQMAKAPKPSDSEVNAFYSSHPELFEHRRVFKLQELAVEVGKDKTSEIQAEVNSKKSINDIAVWLKSKDYKFAANSNVRNAEQLPLEVLKKLQPLKDGEAVVVANERSVNIVFVAASQAQPLAKDKAIPVIEQYFMNQNKNALAKKQMDQLKSAAKIEYIGAFADMKNSEKAKTGKEVNIPDQPATPVLGPVAATIKKDDKAQEHLDKGLAGF